MESFGLLRTNVLLTTNIKLAITPKYDIYLESINSNEEIAKDRFKKFRVNDNVEYENIIPKYYEDFPKNYAFEVKYDNDNDIVKRTYSEQYDDIYFSGSNNISNQDFDYDYEYFAPLYFEKGSFPTNFIIFRVDNPGLIDLNKDNFKEEIVENLKVVENFDLTNKTKLGKWIDKSFLKNDNFPTADLSIDLRNGELTSWSGIDYNSGGFTEKSLLLDDFMNNENTFFQFDKLISESYKDLGIIYPNILNFNFLFSDEPANRSSLRKWSLNRYYGFYIKEMVLSKIVTPYSPNKLKQDTVILEDNILFNPNSSNPFKKDFIKNKTFIEYLGRFYEVILNDNGDYKIISPLDLEGLENDVNNEIIKFENDNIITYNSLYNSNIFSINGFNEADVWIIEIDGKYHTLKQNNNGDYFINSDFTFTISDNILTYFVNETNPKFTNRVNLKNINSDNPPMMFKIYKLNFSEIKDFDTNIINTKYANYEYELPTTVSETLEPKLITENGNSNSNPKDVNEYIYQEELIKIPTTSEYVSELETFSIENSEDQENIDLSTIWRKNPKFLKWGYEKSISGNDYPYRINNNFRAEEYNRISNPYEILPKRIERNLDYFYTINPSNNDYIEHSLHLTFTDDNGVIDTNYNFDLSKYYNSGTYSNDYFNYVFNKKERLANNNVIRNSKKYSNILLQDGVRTNETLFKGVKLKFYEVGDLSVSEGEFGNFSIENITIVPTNHLNDYKFSIILTEKNYNPITDEYISPSQFEWEIIENWKLEEQYPSGKLVLYEFIVFENISASASVIDDSLENPSTDASWDFYNGDTVFWNPNALYTSGEYVYYYNEYYELVDISGIVNFYNPSTSYSINDEVIWKDGFYISLINSNDSSPKNKNNWQKVSSINNPPIWQKVNLFNPSAIYSNNDYVVYQNVLYRSQSNGNIGNIPIENNNWKQHYSFIPNNETVYTNVGNNVLFMNNEYYLVLDNPLEETLNSGIDIHIDKKFKNVLVNIYINDNTMPLLRNINRDDLYIDINQRLTLRNFIDSLNNIDQKNYFLNELKYYIREINGVVNTYSLSDNIENLPLIAICEDPEEIKVNYLSNIKKYINISENVLKPKFKLNNFEINNIDELNFYNTNPIAIEIIRREDEDFEKFFKMYRFNGFYKPIFKEIELFKRPTEYEDLGGNFIFDTELTNFGKLDEIIISKVSKRDDILKLRNTESFKSIYPQLDEFGYTYTDVFIFKSTWDREYYLNISN